MITPKQRAALRAEAHHVQPTVHLGQQGMTPTLLQTLDDMLRTRELVKIAVSRNAELGARDAADALARATDADVVQVIGRKVTLYRENPALEKPAGEPPPWRMARE
ncbi:MAG TPA: ribosome assembly RNA-binding protein YhbY [Gemmatimonadaceae bacterium]|nr:ribosome assembly RNA-binding protein YhbY [Gemmatimonadaceae bacterium]